MRILSYHFCLTRLDTLVCFSKYLKSFSVLFESLRVEAALNKSVRFVGNNENFNLLGYIMFILWLVFKLKTLIELTVGIF